MNGSEIAALMPNLSAKELEAELARAPKAKAVMEAAIAAKANADTALAALQTAAGALTTALVAESATIAGCAEQIAAVNALLPSAEE